MRGLRGPGRQERAFEQQRERLAEHLSEADQWAQQQLQQQHEQRGRDAEDWEHGQWDRDWKTKLGMYLQLVKLAPRLESSRAEQIMNWVVEKLQLAIMQYLAAFESTRHVQLKGEALQRLQAWETSDASSGERSLLEIVAELEDALRQSGVLSAPLQMPKLQEQAATHIARLGHISQQIHAQIRSMMASVDLCVSFDALNDRLLDAKPFEVILSREMSALICQINPELRVLVNQLKTKVERTAQDNLDELQSNLDEKQYKAANSVLQRRKFLELLSTLSVFERMPG